MKSFENKLMSILCTYLIIKCGLSILLFGALKAVKIQIYTNKLPKRVVHLIYSGEMYSHSH